MPDKDHREENLPLSELCACRRYEINDGMALSCITTGRFKTGMLAFSLALPLTKRVCALDLLLCGVLRRGSVKYKDMAAINMRLDELYASSIEIRPVRYGKNEIILFAAETLDNAYALDGTDITGGTIEVILQMLLHPLMAPDGCFESKWVESERKNTVDALKAEVNNTRSYAAQRCAEIMHRDESCYPTLEELINMVSDISREELTAHYRQLISSCRIDVFYVGSLDGRAVADRLKACLNDDAAKGYTAHIDTGTDIVSLCAEYAEGQRTVTEDMPVSQGKLVIGFRTGICADSPDYYAAVVFNEILGGSPASKLFMNVREKLSLCYYCSSSYNMYTGNLTVSSGIDVNNRDRAQSAIFGQIDDMKKGKISDTEFTAAKKSLENWYRQIYDNPFELHGFYSGRALFGLDTTIGECRRRLALVSLEDVIRVAEKLSTDTVYFLRGTAMSGESGEDCDE